jgi:hypothetical protein
MANGTLKVSNIETSSGSGTITLGQSGETIALGSGASLSDIGITEADHWRITSNFVPSSTSTTVINTNWERADGTANGYFGTGMSQSSGIFTFPRTGYYLIDFVTSVTPASTSYASMVMQATTDDSSYSTILRLNMYVANGYVSSSSGTQIIDVTDTSNVKIRFATEFGNASSQAYGSSSYTYTGASFFRLGNT